VVKYDEYGIMDGSTMGKPRKMTREIWLQEVFPEWGSYLNYEIDKHKVEPGTAALWYFGGPSFALKSRAGAVFTVDLYSGSSMFTDYSYCGVCRTSGADKLWWIRINPHVIDPWKFKRLDAVASPIIIRTISTSTPSAQLSRQQNASSSHPLSRRGE
jgi:L-ascorbate 6-phosphate lactonase